MTTEHKKKHKLPPLPKRRKHLKTTYMGFPFYINYRGVSHGDSMGGHSAGDIGGGGAASTGGMDTGSVGMGGGDAGGGSMGESLSEDTNTPEVVLGSVSQEGSKDEDDESIEPKKESPYKYSCAMLNLNPSVASIVDYWVKKNIPKESLYIDEDSGHDGYEEIYHVTLKYGIHDFSPKKLTNLVHGFGPISFGLGTVKKFDAPDFDVIHIKIVDSKILEDVNKLISEGIEHTDTHPEYKPHITLAFVKKGSCDKLIHDPFFDSLSDEVDEICFNSKDGDESFISLKLE